MSINILFSLSFSRRSYLYSICTCTICLSVYLSVSHSLLSSLFWKGNVLISGGRKPFWKTIKSWRNLKQDWFGWQARVAQLVACQLAVSEIHLQTLPGANLFEWIFISVICIASYVKYYYHSDIFLCFLPCNIQHKLKVPPFYMVRNLWEGKISNLNLRILSGMDSQQRKQWSKSSHENGWFTNQIKKAVEPGGDLIIIGDAKLNSNKWNEPKFIHANIASGLFQILHSLKKYPY